MKKAKLFKKKYALRNAFIDNGYIMNVDGEKVIITKPGRKRPVSQSQLSDYGYATVWLGGNIKKAFYVHRLVYELTHGKIKEGYEVDHIDNNVFNNNPKNLRMITKSKNTSKSMQRTIARGAHAGGKHLERPIIKWDGKVQELSIEYSSITEAAAKLNCAQSTICDNLKGRTKFFRKRYYFTYKDGN